MVSAATVLAVKIITGFTTLLVVLSPSVALARVVKNKDVGSVSVLPLLLVLSSSHLWCVFRSRDVDASFYSAPLTNMFSISIG